MKSKILLSLLLLIFTKLTILATPPEKVGILILAHGGSPYWNALVLESTQSVAKKYPVEVAFGMALPRTIKEGIDNLEKKGVNKIVVVPLFISSHSFIIRQSEYLLGLRDKLVDPPLVMDHSMEGHSMSNDNQAADHPMEHGSHGPHQATMDHSQNHDMEQQLAQLDFEAEIIMTSALDDHPLVADILYRRIQDLSNDPNNETVVIVAHGPNPELDNQHWLMEMESLAKQLHDKQKENNINRPIFCLTVRDDADEEIYELAKQNLRSIVRQADLYSEVIVVPLLLSRGSVDRRVAERLQGLDYKWSGETLLPDPAISKFIEVSVAEALN